jgi:glycosidase
METGSSNWRSASSTKQLEIYVWRYALRLLYFDTQSNFLEGSTWTFDPHTSEYYLHCFAVEQPDLNWENSTVIKAVHDTIKFWLKKGVDGFRCDVINFISKAPGYPDAPVTDVLSEFQDASGLFANGPQLRERLQDIGTLLRAYNAFSVGEMPFAKCERQILDMVATKSAAFDMIFQFDM